jgi:MFS family permease
MRGAVVGTELGAEPARHLAARIVALGVAQIISWGTLFYTIAVLGAAMRADLGVSDTLLFGAFSAGLLVSGAASPAVGRWIDAGHARSALSGGSCVGALALAILAFAQGPVTLFAGWIVAGAAMALTLYDPAFAVLHTISGTGYRKASRRSRCSADSRARCSGRCRSCCRTRSGGGRRSSCSPRCT